MNKLTIEYQINTFKSLSISLFTDFIVSTSNLNSSKVDQSRRQKYRKKIEFICYSTNITRSNVIKAASKLAKHFINSSSKHLHATNYCLQYLHEIKHLAIKYSRSRDEKLIVQFSNDVSTRHVFENTTDASFANTLERRSYKKFTFKLYERMID